MSYTNYAYTGLGSGGFFSSKRETTFGTPATGVYRQWLRDPDTNFTHTVEHIENKSQHGIRGMRTPIAGRSVIAGQLKTIAVPNRIGNLFYYFLGAPTQTVINLSPDPNAYQQRWDSNQTTPFKGLPFTIQDAQGSDAPYIYSGAFMHKLTITGDNTSNYVHVMGDIVASSEQSAKGTRPSTFSYSSTNGYSLGDTGTLVAVVGSDSYRLDLNSYTIELDMMAKLDRYYAFSTNIEQGFANDIPKATVSCNIDASQTFLDFARGVESFKLTYTITRNANESLIIEIPVAYLDAGTDIPNTVEHQLMDLNFSSQFQGELTSTGSSTNAIFGVQVRSSEQMSAFV